MCVTNYIVLKEANEILSFLSLNDNNDKKTNIKTM